MKTLLVAPRTDLPYVDAEVQRILRSKLDATPMLGDVSLSDLLDELERGQYANVHFATHSNASGILLSDGYLSASELSPLARANDLQLVTLNTCDSIDTAQMIQNETDAEVIATIAKVPDRLAFQTGALFAQALAKTGDVATAYRLARPGGNRVYVHLAGSVKKK